MLENVEEVKPRGKYPWRKVANGEVWRFVKGEDFDITTRGLANVARKAAERFEHCDRVEVNIRGEEVYIRFVLKEVENA